MTFLIKHYPLSLITFAAILYLSFFTPPPTKLDNVIGIDKLVHSVMYGGFCLVIWFEYLRHNRVVNWKTCRLTIFVFPGLLGGIIEILQQYCTDHRRSGEWIDFLADLLGVVVMWFLAKWYIRKYHCKKQ